MWQWPTKSEEEDVIVAGGVVLCCGRGLVLPNFFCDRTLKMLLLQVVLLLVVVVGWSYHISLARATHYVMSSFEIGDKKAFKITRNGMTELSNKLVNLRRTPEHKLKGSRIDFIF